MFEAEKQGISLAERCRAGLGASDFTALGTWGHLSGTGSLNLLPWVP